MKQLLIRIFSGVVYAGIIVFSLSFSLKSLLTLMFLVCIIAFYELYKLSKVNNKIQIVFGIISAIILILSFGINLFSIHWFTLLLFLLFLAELFNSKKFSFKNIGMTLTGLLFIAVPISFAIKLTNLGSIYDGSFLLKIFILIWIHDSFAYSVGSLFGKYKIYSSISPNKTWEGFFGGMFASLGFSLLIFENSTFSLKIALLFALIVSIFGTFGDLIESMFKRKANIKDSGNIIPGHGGFLDRFDSFFFSIPFIYLILQVIS